MANYPKEIKVKSELQENTNNFNLSCDHLTTMNFGEMNVALYRHNTPREEWECDPSVFARPMPMQMPLMAKADHHLKCFYVPFRVLSPQWNDFINKTPHIPYNMGIAVQVDEMPFITTEDIYNFLKDSEITTDINTDPYDFKINGQRKKLTPLGRYAVKIMNQLGYQMIWDSKGKEHIDAMAILAYAKVYCDFYFTNQYAFEYADHIEIESLFKKDGNSAYNVTNIDLKKIFKFCQYVYYNEDYFTAQWDNPQAPNAMTAIGQINLVDISLNNAISINNGAISGNGTPRIEDNSTPGQISKPITQYAIDSLKKMSDFCARFAMAGVRSVDRYLARFGVLLSSEKMTRSIYYGEQITPCEFGAVYSTAETAGASVGSYAGQGIINSDGKEHKTFKVQSDEYGIILMMSSLIPKIGYYQGIDRNNLHHEAETYFSGVFDQLGTQYTAKAELYVSKDDTTYNGDALLKQGMSYIPRGAEYKVPRDRLTGDFAHGILGAYAGSWHFFRSFNDTYWNNIGGIAHSPYFCRMEDAGQYLRVFNNTQEDAGDHFHVIYQFKINARIHAKELYETYDFESEGKELLLNGGGPKAN